MNLPDQDTALATTAKVARLISRLAETLGPNELLTGEAVSSRAAGFIRPGESLRATALVRPRTTLDVAKVLSLCHAAGVPVVPVSGLTGMSDGAHCQEGEIALSLEFLNQIESLDSASGTLTLQAGVTLQAAQEYAAERGFLLAVDIGSRGSALVGGVIATNAGGLKTVRYGPARDQVLGVEAVLADGRVVDSMHGVIKNNTGIDLRQIFVGSEGILGVVTRAVLRLRPLMHVSRTALIACTTFAQVQELLRAAQEQLGGGLSSFEVMWRDFYEFCTAPGRSTAALSRDWPLYVLIEGEYADEASGESFDRFMEQSLESSLIEDAVIAQSQSQRRELWRIREGTEHLEVHQPQYRYDVSVPVHHMEKYVEGVWKDLQAANPLGHCFTFGHAGDSNLHFVVVPAREEDFTHEASDRIVYGPLRELGGAVSAEHGIGMAKKASLPYSRSPVEIEVMRAIKRALDPRNILNPGKIFDLPVPGVPDLRISQKSKHDD